MRRCRLEKLPAPTYSSDDVVSFAGKTWGGAAAELCPYGRPGFRCLFYVRNAPRFVRHVVLECITSWNCLKPFSYGAAKKRKTKYDGGLLIGAVLPLSEQQQCISGAAFIEANRSSQCATIRK